MPRIQVKIIQVTGLHDTGKHYVEVKINEVLGFRTHSVKGMNPTWNVERVIQFEGPETAKIHFLVYSDKSLGKDRVVAHCACFLRDLKYRVCTPCTVPMKASADTHSHGHSINFALELLALDFGHRDVVAHHHAPAPMPVVTHVEQHCEPEPCIPQGSCAPCEPVVEHCDPCEPHIDSYCEPVREHSPVIYAPPPCPPPAPAPVYMPPPPAPMPPVAPVVMVRVQDSRLEEELRRVAMRRRQQHANHDSAVNESLRRMEELERQLGELEERHHALAARERRAAEHRHHHHHHGHHHHHHHGHHHKHKDTYEVYSDEEEFAPAWNAGSYVSSRGGWNAGTRASRYPASTLVPSVASSRMVGRV